MAEADTMARMSRRFQFSLRKFFTVAAIVVVLTIITGVGVTASSTLEPMRQ